MSGKHYRIQDADNEIRQSGASDSTSVGLALFAIAQAMKMHERKPMDRQSLERHARRCLELFLCKEYASASQDTRQRSEVLLGVWFRCLSAELRILPPPESRL